MKKNQTNTRFVVVAGGVISGVGKGVVTASIGKILKQHGYKTTLIKIDPYINFDAGTLRPTEHGEVWVTYDGGEIDQDLGTYERFMDEVIPKCNNITTGQIYKTVIDRERAGKYLGQTVQFIPHITDEITDRIKDASNGYDFAVVEIGGTVGDYENAPFLFALKALERDLGSHSMAHVLVTYLPVPGHIGEMKAKPTLQAIRSLGEHGIMPDFLVCRSHDPIDEVRRKKIELVAHIDEENILAAPDLESVYQMPLVLEEQHFGQKLLEHFQMPSRIIPEWSAWKKRVAHVIKPERQVRVAIVGKYLDTGSYSLTDSYLSICHALIHAGAELNIGVLIDWIDAKSIENDDQAKERLSGFDGILVPGGFGASGIEGKINTISYARTHHIPYLGLCYGMQLAAIEFARNVCHLENAHTTEVNPETPHPIIDLLPIQKEVLEQHNYGGTMRLGAYKADLKEGSQVHELYFATRNVNTMVDERHRHRYEVNPMYVPLLESAGLLFSGTHMRSDGTQLMEFIELSSHPFFVATQAHPEFTSRFGNPNPLFYGFVHACSQQADAHGAAIANKQQMAMVP